MKSSIGENIERILKSKNDENDDFLFKTVILPEKMKEKGIDFLPVVSNDKTSIKFYINGIDATNYVNTRISQLKTVFRAKKYSKVI